MSSTDPILKSLNKAQYEVVRAPVIGQYQVLAGPGTGKTKTLTSRIGYLMRTIPAENILVMTFTNQAAKEMKSRLEQMLKESSYPIVSSVSKLNIGTFHGECFKYLVRYGTKIGLPKKLVIADPTDQATILKDILGEAEFVLKMRELGYVKEGKLYVNDSGSVPIQFRYFRPDAKTMINRISKCKSKGVTLEIFRNKPDHDPALEIVYQRYQTELEKNGMVDFDDIMIKSQQLLRENPEIVSNIQAVLVDEFQDSNIIQLELTQLFAQATNNITIVGDPDQSIYSFRHARAENIRVLNDKFPQSKIIYLEENYRSTQPILDVATSLISQDANRIGRDRVLRSQELYKISKKDEMRPVVAEFRNEDTEAKFVGEQIHILKQTSGGILDYQDMAVLARTSYASKKIEISLASHGIPYRLLSGFQFWDHTEVRAVVDYLRVINSDNDRAAIMRTLNMPKRGFGDVSLQKILSRINEGQAFFTQLESFAFNSKLRNSHGIKLRSDSAQGLNEYVTLIHECREKLKQGGTGSGQLMVNIVEYILEKTGLIKALVSQDSKSEEIRIENIDLLKSHILTIFNSEDNENEINVQTNDGDHGDDDVDDDVNEFDDFYNEFIDERKSRKKTTEKQPEKRNINKTIVGDMTSALETLLISLSFGGDADHNNENFRNRVTISTIHSAKGLEWPVIFSINTIDDQIVRCGEDERQIAEERRLLFVSLTRAKVLLYITYPTEIHRYMSDASARLSRLLSDQGVSRHYVKSEGRKGIKKFTRESFINISKFLGRRPPSDLLNLSSASGNGKVYTSAVSGLGGFQSATDVLEKQNKRKRTTSIPKSEKRPLNESTSSSNAGTKLYPSEQHDRLPPFQNIANNISNGTDLQLTFLNSQQDMGAEPEAISSPSHPAKECQPSEVLSQRRTLGVRRIPSTKLPFM